MAKSVGQKLLIKAGMAAAIVDAPEGYAALLGDLPEGVTLADTLDGHYDLVQVFVRNRAALDAVVAQAVGGRSK